MATREFMGRYAQALQGPKTPERLNELIADDTLLRHIAEAEAALPGYTIDVEDLVIEGSKAVLRGRLCGVQRGEFHGVPPTGREVNVPIFVMYDVQNGRITRHWMMLDTLAMMQQLGVVSA
ncbi:ester cyclase [Deinococcus malanensis]